MNIWPSVFSWKQESCDKVHTTHPICEDGLWEPGARTGYLRLLPHAKELFEHSGSSQNIDMNVCGCVAASV